MDGTSGDAENLSYSSEVQGVISLSGALHIKEWLDENSVPFISIHGTADDIVPYNEGLAIGFLSMHGSGNLHPRADEVGVDLSLIHI